MATVASSFSPRYPSFNGAGALTSAATVPSYDLQAFFDWLKGCGADVLENIQELLERLKTYCLEVYFRPTYGLQAPAMTLSVAEVHEAIAKQLYIDSIGVVLGSRAAERLQNLADIDHGWDGGDAQPMALRSLATMQTFFRKAECFAPDIGFYLGYEGEILISWTSKAEGLIDMAFYDDVAELSSDSGDFEFSVRDPELYSLISSKYYS